MEAELIEQLQLYSLAQQNDPSINKNIQRIQEQPQSDLNDKNKDEQNTSPDLQRQPTLQLEQANILQNQQTKRNKIKQFLRLIMLQPLIFLLNIYKMIFNPQPLKQSEIKLSEEAITIIDSIDHIKTFEFDEQEINKLEEIQSQKLKYINLIKSKISLFILIITIFVFAFSVVKVFQYIDDNLFDQQSQALNTGSVIAEDIINQIKQSMAPAYSLASLIRPNVFGDNFTRQNFKSIAESLLVNRKFINNLQLSPNGVITNIEPLNNVTKNIIGLDVINNPKVVGALDAIKLQSFMYSNPYIPAGYNQLGMVGRFPIFTNYSISNYTNNKTEKFWGFASVLMLTADLFNAANLNSLYDQFKYTYKIINLKNNQTLITSPNIDQNATLQQPIRIPISYLNQQVDWELQIEPISHWDKIPVVIYPTIILLILQTVQSLVSSYKKGKMFQFNNEMKEYFQFLVKKQLNQNDNI